MQDILNMEPLCAEYGMKIVEEAQLCMTLADCENVINRALGILVENGFYAMGVYLLSNKVAAKNNYGGRVLRAIVNLLSTQELGICTVNGQEDGIALLLKLRSITNKLDKLLLARKLTEETLTFARYHCKALSVVQAAQQQARKG